MRKKYLKCKMDIIVDVPDDFRFNPFEAPKGWRVTFVDDKGVEHKGVVTGGDIAMKENK